MNWDEELELIHRAKHGDGDAFATLWKGSENKVWAVCLGITSNRSDAEEAIAEAMCKSWQGIDRFQAKSRFSTWLCQIASNICKNKVTRRREFPDSETGADLASDTTDFADRVSAVDAVRWALSQLTPEFREVILLREIGGLSYQEIAVQQGVNIQTVKSRLHRARKAMKKLLGDAGYGDASPDDIPGSDPADDRKDDTGKKSTGGDDDHQDDDEDQDGDDAGTAEPTPVR